METLKRTKPFKASTPDKTINRIREILSEVGIFTTEIHYSHNDKFHACRVSLNNNDVKSFSVGTNGKGMYPGYAVASAYGEFMERLQNGVLLMKHKFALQNYKYKNVLGDYFVEKLKHEDLELNFTIAPDEKLIKTEEVVDYFGNNLKQMFCIDDSAELVRYIKDDLHFDELVCIPYFDAETKETIMLPHELLKLRLGSNGMCAGNTPKEAIIQGICEIFERFAMTNIGRKELTPPTISKEYFKGHEIYDRMTLLESENDCQIIIKDCSLGIGLPVLAALIINNKTHEYFFHLGSDTSPVTALERCFTEIYQGLNSKEIKAKSRKIHLTRDIYSNGYQDREKVKYDEHMNNIRDGIGNWPQSILGDEPSWVFDGFNYTESTSDDRDFEYLLEIIKTMNKNVYVRDMSHLGFPTYFVYIPGLSEHKWQRDTKNYSFRTGIFTLFNLKHSKDHEIAELAESLEYFNENISNLFWYANSDIINTDADLFRAMLFHKIRNHKKAASYLTKFLNRIPDKLRGKSIYYFCARDYLHLLDKISDEERIIEKLRIFYKDNLIKEVIEDLKDPDKVFEYTKLPSCFDCYRCEVTEKCKFFKLLRIQKKIENIHINNVCNQEKLAEIFS